MVEKDVWSSYWLAYSVQFWALLGLNEIVWIASCNSHGHKAAMDVQFQLSDSLFTFFFCFFYSHDEKAEFIAYASTLCALNFKYQIVEIMLLLCVP
jgi:hypothetical protein